MELPSITEISFYPCKPREGLVGFVDFLYEGTMKVVGAGVHRLLDTEGQYRLVYPKNLTDGKQTVFPIKREVSKHIDSIITSYVNNQKGVNNDPQNPKGRAKASGNKNQL